MKPFELAPLPYAYDYLEPVIDVETMKLHHDKHHQAYVNNLNAAIAKYPDLAYGCVDCILCESRQSSIRRQKSNSLLRCLGTCILLALPKPSPRLY